ncbi:MAG TPA: DUF2254 domain-containing protein [Acidimicrobiales bacterium]
MRIGLAALVERVRSSFFFVPMLFVVGAAMVGQVSLEIDEALSDRDVDLPLTFRATVDSARAVLSTVATATITVAGIAFSVALLVIQLASSQYSPRVVHGLFRDPFSKWVMGLVVGTFTFCLVVLRSVRDALEGGEPVVPTLSVAIALVLGVTAILAIIAFIDHNAHSMDVSELLHGVTSEALHAVGLRWPESSDGGTEISEQPPDGDGFLVAFDQYGWIQQVDGERLLAVAPPGGTVRLEVAVGRYAVPGTPLCTIWPPPPEDDRPPVARAARAAVMVGRTRTMQQDSSYGIRQLADVALRALSSGVNDPTTAQDAIFHMAAVLQEMLRRSGPPRATLGEEGRRLLRPEAQTHAGAVALGFDELRQAARDKPAVCVYLLEALHLLCESLPPDAGPAASDPLRQQARLVLDGCEAADLLPHDLHKVRHTYTRRFGT